MHRLYLRIPLLVIFLIAQSALYCQLPNIKFRKISPDGGFARHAINSIVQDDLGYIWLGTKQGLIRYDSNNTDWFMPILHDTLSLPSEEVNQVYVDKNNNIWASTAKGVCRFNRPAQNFERIFYNYEDGSDPRKRVISILQISDGRYLLIDTNHFGVLDTKNKQLNRLGKGWIKTPQVLFQDTLKRVWIGTRNGDVFRFFPKTNSVKKLISIKAKITCIYAEGEKLWIGTEENGVKIFDTHGEFIKQEIFRNKDQAIKSERIRTIIKDSYNRLWFGTDEGLFLDTKEGLRWLNPDHYPGIPHNSIFEIYENKKGSVWIGTWSGGLALMHPHDNNFETFRHSTTQNSIGSNTVSSFWQISKNEMLVGTEVGGLNLFNLETERFDVITLNKELRVKNIKTICKDKHGGIWAGTFRKGLWYKSPGASEFRVFTNGPDDGKHISAFSVYALLPVETGVWIGTFHGGINFYDFKTNTIQRPFIKNDQNVSLSRLPVQCLYKDNDSNLWIGTLHGSIYRIHLPSGVITTITDDTLINQYNLTSIYTLWQHSSGDIWIGTKNNGILVYNPTTKKIGPLELGSEFHKKNVYGIIEDDQKNIWITSNDGLIVMNTKTNHSRHFVHSDGIQSNIFSPKAVYKDHKGLLYFGGTNGFTRINPRKIQLNKDEPFTLINSIQINNDKVIYPNYTGKYITDPIYLDADQTTFRVKFSSDNYLIPEKNRYSYRLSNHYNNWIEVGNEGSVLFTNLDAGTYIFEVKSSNNDGVWNDSPTRMKVVIKEYWYKTFVAYSIYCILVLVALFLFSRSYLERAKLQRAILNEQNQRKNEEQMHEMKLKFFTNISHEFRTPISLISWPLQQLSQSKSVSPKDQRNIKIAKQNTNRLLQLINQIIDSGRRSEREYQLNVSTFDLIDLVKKIKENFIGEAESKQIDFTVDSSYSHLEIEADHQKLDIIIFNLLSNAFKFVSTNGKIRIFVDKKMSRNANFYNNQLSYGQLHTDDFVQLTVEDNGSGIDNEDLIKIFNRFEQGKMDKKQATTNQIGSGIGLSVCKEFTLLHSGKIIVRSTLGQGSCFTVLLPLKQKVQEMLFESHKKVRDLMDQKVVASKLNRIKVHKAKNHILVVEDNVEFNSFICELLSGNYQVSTANNGSTALSILEHKDIDLIISDVMMPEMDGYEFCNIVKSQIGTSHIPIILLTALSSTDHKIVGLDEGADAYLTKPFDEVLLIKQIENLLEQRRRIHKNFTERFTSKDRIQVSGLDNFFLKRVQKVIEDNLANEDFGIHKLAEELMMSRSNLHRKIKSLSGLSTSEFVNLIRVQCAVKLIKEKNFRFNEVAFRVGFSSQSYFTRCFKKVYKVAPKEYFKQNSNPETRHT